MFETHPEVRESFMSFGEVNSDDLYVNAQLRAHALRVMTTVEKVLARIDSDEKLDKLLTELGERHSQYRSKAVHMQVRGKLMLWHSLAQIPSLEYCVLHHYNYDKLMSNDMVS